VRQVVPRASFKEASMSPSNGTGPQIVRIAALDRALLEAFSNELTGPDIQFGRVKEAARVADLGFDLSHVPDLFVLIGNIASVAGLIQFVDWLHKKEGEWRERLSKGGLVIMIGSRKVTINGVRDIEELRQLLKDYPRAGG
jgi:hypothetical protein